MLPRQCPADAAANEHTGPGTVDTGHFAGRTRLVNEPGIGHQVLGELYEVDEAGLARIDAMESIGRPGNLRILIDVAPIHESISSKAYAYMKSRALADPIHSDYLSSYQDRRFIPPERRGSP